VLGSPAELVPDLLRIEQIAPVVPRAIGDDRLQGGGLAGELQHEIGDLLDRRPRPEPTL
jgi:hypothetical protein